MATQLEHPDWINGPIRVPGLRLERWIYLRAWSGFNDRTCCDEIVASFGPEGGGLFLEDAGLSLRMVARGEPHVVKDTINQILLAAGAEPVAEKDWPLGGFLKGEQDE